MQKKIGREKVPLSADDLADIILNKYFHRHLEEYETCSFDLENRIGL